MKKTKLLSMILSLVLVSCGFNLFSPVAMAAPQTLTILGAQGTPGETDPYTEFSLDNGQTWNQAFLYGGHPWGFVPGTNSWLNIGPSGTAYGLYQSVLYRVRFNVPEGSLNPQLTFDVKADNYATIWLNGTYVADIEGAGGTTADATINGAVQPGLNEIKLLVTDVGGWAGFNYKITLNVDSPTPPTLIDTIAPTAAVSYSNVNPTNQDVVAAITPSEPVTITNNGGSASYAFSGNGSFTFEFIDAAGNTGSATATVANIDKVAPTATVAYSTTAPTNQDVVAVITPSEAVTITNNGGSNSYTFTQNGSFTFEFIDAAGNQGSVIATVSNIDRIAPTLKITLNQTVLKQNNHKMVNIQAALTAKDNNPEPLSIVLTSITSNEPDNGLGDGDTRNDIQGAEFGTFDTDFELRAERSGKGNGRIYTITYTITDAAGNQSTAVATVVVKHDNSNPDNAGRDNSNRSGNR